MDINGAIAYDGKRKSVFLDPLLFYAIPEPEMIKADIFGGRKVKEKNARILENHKDWIEARKKFIEQIGYGTWKKEVFLIQHSYR